VAKYKVITYHKPSMLSPSQVRGSLRSAAAKGRRIIGGRAYVLVGSEARAAVENAAKKRRKAGQSCRIFKSKYYGDWELWVSRVDRRE
jgi:hypothetical protein